MCPHAALVLWLLALLLLSSSCAHAALFWLPGDAALAPALIGAAGSGSHATTAHAPWSPRRGMRAAVVVGDRIVAIGGSGAQLHNDEWEYADQGWTRVQAAAATFSPRVDFTLNAFAQQLVLIGGKDSSGVLNDVWSRSATAAAAAGWTRHSSSSAASSSFAPRSAHCAVAMGDALFVFAGWNENEFVEYNDVWRWSGVSSDPWLSVGTAPFSARFGAAAVAWNGTVVMVGGTSSKANLAYNDVWVFDGTLWDSLLLAAFTGRSFHSALVFGSSLLVLGGSDVSAVAQNQVWSYASSWGQSVAGAWTPRRDMLAIVNPRAYGQASPGESVIVIGGQDANGPTNDVWVLQDLQPPSAPLSVRSQAIQSPSLLLPSSSVLVSWLAPADSGGSPVLEYMVSNDFDAFVQNCSAPALAVAVTGLTFPANYSFQVYAINLAGRGAVSDASNTVATAAAGRYVNGGGVIPTEAEDVSSALAGGSSSLSSRVWFIVLLVLLSVGLFVLGCFLIVRRHLHGAQRDLQKLEEIENMDDDDEETGSCVPRGSAAPPIDLAAVGITGIGRRCKADELAKWRRGESSSSVALSAVSSASRHLDPALTRPLGFAVGSDEEAEAIARLAAEMERLQQADDGPHQDGMLTSEGDLRVLCDDFAEALCDAFQREYTLRLHGADPDDAATVPRMGPSEEIRAVLSHALYASSVLRPVSSQSPLHRSARSQLHAALYAALLSDVSSSALSTGALHSALDNSGVSHLFLLARASMLTWMFERVKSRRDHHPHPARVVQEPPSFRDTADALSPSPPARRVLPTSAD